MLATEDVEDLFTSMRTAYGGQWKHAQGAVRVWRNALSRFTPEDLRRASNTALHEYVNHPPTLPQFLKLVKPPERANTYLPAPTMTPAQVAGNKVLAVVLRNAGGVDNYTLKNLVGLKNALVEDCGEQVTEKLIDDLEQQLTALAGNHDREAKAQEREEGRRKFCVQRGVPYRSREDLRGEV